MVEIVASLVHDIWSRWMEYVFSKAVLNEDGSYTIPVEFVDRWQRQIDTFYEDLTEKERYSDKEFAKEILQVIKDEEESWD
jgi:hypothetical protein